MDSVDAIGSGVLLDSKPAVGFHEKSVERSHDADRLTVAIARVLADGGEIDVRLHAERSLTTWIDGDQVESGVAMAVIGWVQMGRSCGRVAMMLVVRPRSASRFHLHASDVQSDNDNAATTVIATA